MRLQSISIVCLIGWLAACHGCDQADPTPATTKPVPTHESTDTPPPEPQGVVPTTQNGAESESEFGANSGDDSLPLPPHPIISDAFANVLIGEYDQARAVLLANADALPDDGRAEFIFALSHHKQRNYGAARPYFESALSKNLADPNLHHFYGYCLYYLGEPEAARKAFERHIQALPTIGDSHFAIGLIELDAGNLDPAAERFNVALSLFEGVPSRQREVAAALGHLGDIANRRDDLEQARKHLEHAVKIDPNLYAAWQRLARVLERLGEPEAAARARTQYDRAIERVRPEPAPASP